MKIVLSYGLGADSTAILLRWLIEPATRTFDLADLIVVSAQTGDEWSETGHLVEQYVYPLLAKHGIRTVQVARKSKSQRDGIVILDDTRTPTRCYVTGAYKLSDELIDVATVPQTGGKRLCSLKSKGWPLDTFIAELTKGEDFVHVVGYESDELSRMLGDAQVVGLPGRIPTYPLIEWGWDRATCEQYIHDQLGVWWPKSACVQCPYALATAAGRARTIPRFLAHPDEAMRTLTMEYLAVAINPRQGLIGGRQLLDELEATEGSGPLLDQFEQHLDSLPWAIYDVRRAFRAHPDDMMRPANAARSLTRVHEGTRGDMIGGVRFMATLLHPLGARLETGRHHRLWLHERNLYYPCVEQLVAAAPALASDKTNKTFSSAWRAGLEGPAQLSLSF